MQKVKADEKTFADLKGLAPFQEDNLAID